MKNITVLGSGCAKCKKTADSIEKIADALGVAVTVVKETDAETIMGLGIMSTPAVVIDEQLVHSGSIPQRGVIESWLNDQ